MAGSPARPSAAPEAAADVISIDVITIDDCVPGRWVEVSNGNSRDPWRGIIERVDPSNERPVCVKWLGRCRGKRWPDDTPEDVWTWHGGSHFIEVETLNDVGEDLFHRARRDGFPTEGLPLKEDAEFFCLRELCDGRCNPENAPNRYVRPKPPERPPRKKDPKPPPPKEPREKKKPAPKPPAAPAPKRKRTPSPPPPPPPRERESAPLKPIFEWEPKITADCKPSDVLVPFTYIRHRIFSANDGTGKYTIEPRADARCCCRRSLEPMLVARMGPVRDLHESAGGRCAYLALQSGAGPLFNLHIFQSNNGKGYGVKAREAIPKGQLIIEYIGEVITSTEATRRERSYSQLGLFYLHDIHATFSGHDRESFTLDPTMYGNAARMLNHSCEPNVTTFEVNNAWGGERRGDEEEAAAARERTRRVPRVARVGFFASRDVAAGEELCIDYSPGKRGKDLQKVMRCFCGTANCKEWLF